MKRNERIEIANERADIYAALRKMPPLRNGEPGMPFSRRDSAALQFVAALLPGETGEERDRQAQRIWDAARHSYRNRPAVLVYDAQTELWHGVDYPTLANHAKTE